ncbi:hypothetical protein AtNW77_Chr5g0114821 [Arabidopsis thaliana]
MKTLKGKYVSGVNFLVAAPGLDGIQTQNGLQHHMSYKKFKDETFE